MKNSPISEQGGCREVVREFAECKSISYFWVEAHFNELRLITSKLLDEVNPFQAKRLLAYFVDVAATSQSIGALLSSMETAGRWYTAGNLAKRMIGKAEHTADILGLTTFEVFSSRKISNLKALKNNITTSEKKLFLRHNVSILNQLMSYSDCLDYVFVFDLLSK